MVLSDLIGLKVSKIRFSYETENKEGAKKFYSYVKLSNGKIINIPRYPDNTLDLVKKYEDSKKSSFLTAKRCGMASRVLFKNKEITDIHFKYSGSEHVEESGGVLELENGIYISENNFGSKGITNIDLQILTKQQFDAIKKQHTDVEIRSFSG